MNDHLDSLDDPPADEMAALRRLLASDDVWHDADPSVEDTVVTAIAGEVGSAPEQAPAMLDERRATRAGSRNRQLLAAAAVVAVVVAGVAIVSQRGDDRDDGGVQIALAGTDAAPGATAEVSLAATPAGLKILLDAEGLEPAPEGYFYEAWVSDGSVRVSAGTFHLRGGDGPIELWAGVVEAGFDRLAVTLEPLDGDTDSSGDVRLRGTFDLAGG